MVIHIHHWLASVLLVAGAVGVASCSRNDGHKESAANAAAHVPAPETADIILHVVDAAKIGLPFRKDSDESAAGGYVVSVPPKAGKALGAIELDFEIVQEGLYSVWIRGFWGTDGEDACSNSILLGVDDSHPVIVQDATYQTWHWLQARLGGGKKVPIQLGPGPHKIRILSREDGLKLDQLFITPWNEDEFERRVPQGIEQ